MECRLSPNSSIAVPTIWIFSSVAFTPTKDFSWWVRPSSHCLSKVDSHPPKSLKSAKKESADIPQESSRLEGEICWVKILIKQILPLPISPPDFTPKWCYPGRGIPVTQYVILDLQAFEKNFLLLTSEVIFIENDAYFLLWLKMSLLGDCMKKLKYYSISSLFSFSAFRCLFGLGNTTSANSRSERFQVRGHVPVQCGHHVRARGGCEFCPTGPSKRLFHHHFHFHHILYNGDVVSSLRAKGNTRRRSPNALERTHTCSAFSKNAKAWEDIR